ncbi:MAG: hypothetical protein EB090_02470 [Verrucomicrobia bacterium]|nr:hypothetical protein [Verrucomicrobiota bacterium]
MGHRLRGLIEMTAALTGTLLFCVALVQGVGNRADDVPFLHAIKPYWNRIGTGLFLVLASWLSGVLFAKRLFRR